MKRLSRQVAIYGLGELSFRFLAFAVFPIYTHLFSVEQYGVLALVNTSAGLVQVVLTLGLNYAVQRYYLDPDTLKERRPVLVSTGLVVLALWSSVVTVLLLFSLYPFRGALDQRYDIEWIFLVLALGTNVPLLITKYSQDILRVQFSPWQYTLVDALRNLSGVAAGLYLVVVLNQGLLGIFAGPALALTLLVPLSLWMIRKELTWRFDFGYARAIVLFGYPFAFTGLAYWVFGFMDRWLLGVLSDNTTVGLYSIAYSLAGGILLVITAFAAAWSPFAINMYAEDPDYRDKLSSLFSYWFFALALVGLVISLFGREVLRLLTPEAYWPAATPLSVLTMGLVLFGTTQFTALGLQLVRRTGLLSVGAWIAAIANLLLNFALIPLWGAVGAGLATFAAYALLTGLYLYWSQKRHHFPLEVKKLSFCLLIVIFTPLFSGFLNTFTWDIWLVGVKILILGLVIFLGFAASIINLSDIRRLSSRGIS